MSVGPAGINFRSLYMYGIYCYDEGPVLDQNVCARAKLATFQGNAAKIIFCLNTSFVC